MSTTQQTGFVDPSSLSLPSSSSLKRSVSPSSSRDDSPDPQTFAEPPRKRPRSAVTPEERKEARAHRNRIAAQNSRDRRKAQFSFLERRVTELEEENRRLRAGIPASPASTSVSEPEVIVVETEEARKQTRDNEQRERENEELRERIRTLEKGYEAVVRALAAQAPIGAATVPSPAGIPTPPASSSPAPPTTSTSPSSTSTGSSSTPSPAPLAQSSYPLSPAPTNATLANSPALFANDSFDFPQSPEFSLDSIVDLAAVSDITVPSSSIDLSLNHGHAPTRHLARVATTSAKALVALQRVGGVRLATSQMSVGKKCAAVNRSTCSPKTRQLQTPPSRVCSQRSSRRRRLALALFQALALRQKIRARRC
ncbi:hypothetical protein BV22DRAFT_869213 [Leucogyrophana mollusca]|uniref:Uncharacterized protein n=1 Tax=Leucogyrophana mollusca TaxID=85980 RepID=A0ACB8B212_9AGAM|nr:hypothetical protein BV22DRAFT_869213 [Leucogyrophana mollusca]